MIALKKHLPRRTFLKGMAGAAVGLPFLDAMVPALTAQVRTAANAPLRAAFAYFPHGCLVENWVPQTTGAGYEMRPVLRPLEAYRDRMLILSNLAENPTKVAGTGHAAASSTWLSGAVMKDTKGADVYSGTTVDQILARQMGQDTPIPSLELGIEDISNLVGTCDGTSSCAYINAVSWQSPTTPLPAEINPRAVFERMFGDGTSPAERAARRRADRSLLDDIASAARDLQRSVGAQDRVRIGDYLDNLREIERRIDRAEQRTTEIQIETEAPVEIPELYHEHVGLMFELQALAFQADVTRVASFMMSRELSGRTFPQIGVPEQHHGLSHHGGRAEAQAKYLTIATYLTQLFATFVEKLQATPDGDGTLLDHSMVLFGSGMSDGNVHARYALPLVLVGGANGALQGGRHLRFAPLTPIANLHLSLLATAGAKEEQIGNATEAISLS